MHATTGRKPDDHATAQRRLIAAALALGTWALFIRLTGGFHVEPFGVRLSSTDYQRPLILACVLLAIYGWRWPNALRDHVRALGLLPLRRSGLIVAGLAAAVLVAAILCGATVAGSADAYGYVSQSLLWRKGQLTVPIDLIRRVPWPNAQWTFSPLGYRPSPSDAGAIVPTYAPGLPLLMAVAQIVGGFGATFLVVPVAAAALIGLTYALGRMVGLSKGVAVWGALLVAVSPAFLFQAMWPMTDVPVAVAWTGALLLAAADLPLGAGLLASATLAIRPNLVLLPASLLLWLVARDARAAGWLRVRSAVRFAAGTLPAVIAIALLNRHLYGSATASGYGTTSELFALGNAWTNAAHDGTWLLQTQTPLIAGALLFFAAPGPVLPRLLFGGTIAATFASYLFYQPFDDWWYLRFLLPMWPVLMLATAAGLDDALRRWVPWLRPFLLTAAVVFLAWSGVRTAARLAVFGIGRGERRYVDVAREVDRQTAPDAIVFAMQHSGSIRLYGGRLTLRYDWLDPHDLDRAIAFLQSIGRHPYLVIEKWEHDPFVARFGGVSRTGRLDWLPVATLQGWNDVALYDLAPAGSAPDPHAIPQDEIRRCTGWPAPAPHP